MGGGGGGGGGGVAKRIVKQNSELRFPRWFPEVKMHIFESKRVVVFLATNRGGSLSNLGYDAMSTED